VPIKIGSRFLDNTREATRLAVTIL
jgi:hypothetical protein